MVNSPLDSSNTAPRQNLGALNSKIPNRYGWVFLSLTWFTTSEFCFPKQNESSGSGGVRTHVQEGSLNISTHVASLYFLNLKVESGPNL